MTVLGGLLTVGGLAGIALLVASPDTPPLLYASRPVVVLAGLPLILPAILLIAPAAGAGLVGGYPARAEATRETP